jgi:hypothetical protein
LLKTQKGLKLVHLLSYHDDLAETGHERIWPEVIHAWGNKREVAPLLTFLNRYGSLFNFINRFMF